MLQMSIKSLVVTTVLYVVGSHGYDCQEMSTMSDGYVCYCQSGCTGSCCGGQALIFGQYKDLASTSCRSCAGAIPTCEEGSGASYDDTNSICLCPYMTQGCSGNGCTESSFRDGSPAFYWVPDSCGTKGCACITTTTTVTTVTVTTATATTTTITYVQHSVRVNGACSSQSGLNADFTSQGVTADGKPYYQSEDGSRYLYYDKDCSGAGSGPERWIFSTLKPSTTATSDLDEDDACSYSGRIYSQASTPPQNTNVWRIYCDEDWSDVNLSILQIDLKASTTVTTKTATTMTATTRTTKSATTTTRPTPATATTSTPTTTTLPSTITTTTTPTVTTSTATSKTATTTTDTTATTTVATTVTDTTTTTVATTVTDTTTTTVATTVTDTRLVTSPTPTTTSATTPTPSTTASATTTTTTTTTTPVRVKVSSSGGDDIGNNNKLEIPASSTENTRAPTLQIATENISSMNGTALVTPELPYQDAAGAKNSTATAAGSIAAAVVATAVGVLSLFFIRKRRKSARGIPAGFVRHNAAFEPAAPANAPQLKPPQMQFNSHYSEHVANPLNRAFSSESSAYTYARFITADDDYATITPDPSCENGLLDAKSNTFARHLKRALATEWIGYNSFLKEMASSTTSESESPPSGGGGGGGGLQAPFSPADKLRSAVLFAADSCGDATDAALIRGWIERALSKGEELYRKQLESNSLPSQTITAADIAAIYLYTVETELYSSVNRALRRLEQDPEQQGYADAMPFFPYIKLLIVALEKLPVVKDVVVFRGIKVPVIDLLGSTATETAAGGVRFLWPAFTSTALSPDVLRTSEFLGVGAYNGDRTAFQIKINDGRDISAFSYYAKGSGNNEEEEILLLPGACFEVELNGITEYANNVTEVRALQLRTASVVVAVSVSRNHGNNTAAARPLPPPENSTKGQANNYAAMTLLKAPPIGPKVYANDDGASLPKASSKAGNAAAYAPPFERIDIDYATISDNYKHSASTNDESYGNPAYAKPADADEYIGGDYAEPSTKQATLYDKSKTASEVLYAVPMAFDGNNNFGEARERSASVVAVAGSNGVYDIVAASAGIYTPAAAAAAGIQVLRDGGSGGGRGDSGGSGGTVAAAGFGEDDDYDMPDTFAAGGGCGGGRTGGTEANPVYAGVEGSVEGGVEAEQQASYSLASATVDNTNDNDDDDYDMPDGYTAATSEAILRATSAC